MANPQPRIAMLYGKTPGSLVTSAYYWVSRTMLKPGSSSGSRSTMPPATPISEGGSEIISLKDLQIFGNMDTMTGDLVLRVMETEEVRTDIEKALVENFSTKYQGILEKAKKGIFHLRMGDLTITMDMTEIEHGAVQVTSAGLFMPVTARGQARVRLGAN